MAEQTKDMDDPVHQPETCDPCSISEKESEATTFCIDCEENLCEICTKAHATRKVTKEHEPIPIHEKKKCLAKYCDSCVENPQEAFKYCELCEEYLCTPCVKAHSKRKATKDHVPIDLALIQQLSAESDEADRVCDICLQTGQKVKAENYCDHCIELLCIDCTNVHKNSKATRLHKPIPVSDLPELKNINDGKNCEPCSQSNSSKPAVKYCESCEEFLCDNCGKRHGLQTSTRTHVLKNANDIEVRGQCCDICLKINETKPAELFCQKCSEALCDYCVRSHKNQKATRDHILIPVKERSSSETQPDMNMCDPCKSKEVSIYAGHYCGDCELFLCDTCKDKHIRQKLTKNHNIKDASSAAASAASNTMSKSSLCAQCLSVNEESIAVNHCIECSEDLCDDCITMHKMQKQTKSHKIVALNEILQPSTELCEQCKARDLQAIALKYCIVCEEFLCQGCCEFHSRYKQTMNHELKNVDEFIEESRCNCDSCMFSDKIEAEAECFCNECKEFLCTACKDRHKAAKLSKTHSLLTIEEGRKQALKNMLLCDPCKYFKKTKKANAYCDQCRELLCDQCANQHSTQRLTRDHSLLRDLSKYNPEAMTEEYPARLKDEEVGNKDNKATKKDEEQKTKQIPGKPTSSAVTADSVVLVWEKPEVFDDKQDYYQVSYKEANEKKWKFFPGEYDIANVKVTDLKANTKYIFRVRIVHPDGEGQYSEDSDALQTIDSPAARIIQFSTRVKDGNPTPSIYRVPITEIANARNQQSKTKKFEVGEKRLNVSKEKTIMLVGATGTGKSTLVDGLVNFALGVNWSDKFRFTTIDMEEEEKARHKDQAQSQTEWITVYTIHPEPGGRLDYRLNIIDTPGFGDTRGLERDQQIVEQIRGLFSEGGAKGVVYIDAICFLIKAPDARLTAVQSYIFQSIMALFGKDVEHNICSLITFADGLDPPVLSALEASELPFGTHFTFNNSGLFAKNNEAENAGLSPMFWEMGIKSFGKFFSHLEKMETKSLTLTKNVLDERKKLETTVQNLQPQVDAGLAKLNMLNEEIRIIKQHKLDADANKDFQYEVEEIEQKRHELPKGQHTTNCLHCHFTCHKSCVYANDDEKRNCGVMDGNGYCTQCAEKCHWQQHANTPFIFEYVSVKKQKTYKEKLAKYQDAEGKRLSHEQVVEKMGEELDELQEGVEHLMNTVRKCTERLGEIALRPNPLSMVDHIDLMVQAEKMEKKAGYMQRIAMLDEMRQRALITTKAAELTQKVKQHSRSLTQGGEKDGKKPEKLDSKGFSLKKFIGNLFTS